eukprot:c9269_g1_i1.p1 GENE.c9269_g1_i1~~c9269_g1_i1.p1  ORF type:complete len:650 (-),score=151.20 c9269_g1_i1:140-2089(-)
MKPRAYNAQMNEMIRYHATQKHNQQATKKAQEQGPVQEDPSLKRKKLNRKMLKKRRDDEVDLSDPSKRQAALIDFAAKAFGNSKDLKQLFQQNSSNPEVQKKLAREVSNLCESKMRIGRAQTMGSGQKVYVWRVRDPATFVHPELRLDTHHNMEFHLAKPDFGIAVSGGSMRAICCGMGWFRALEMLGVPTKARYISSNSGGSFVNAAYSFQQKFQVEQFLGLYVPPEQCDLSRMDKYKYDCVFGNILHHMHHVVRRFVKAVLRGRFKGAIAEVLCSSLLHPLNLADIRGIMSLTTSDKMLNAGAMPYVVPQDRPFPIINCSILLPNDPMRFHPFEFTPMYCGSVAKREYDGRVIGGCLMEPMGFNSPKPLDLVEDDEDGFVSCATHNLVSLQEMVGASASFVSVALQQLKVLDDLPFSNDYNYWCSPDDDERTLAFSDGGGFDNIAILPLLRRRVSKILCLVAAAENNHMTPDDDHDFNMLDVATLFGAARPDLELFAVRGDDLNKRCQVFPTEAYKDLLASLATCQLRGRPLVHTAKLRVLDNEYCGVTGGWEVSVMFLFNGPCQAWEDRLPKETKGALLHDRTSRGVRCMEDYCSPGKIVSLNDFPCVPTSEYQYSPRMIGMLSNQCCWTLLQSQAELALLMEQGF